MVGGKGKFRKGFVTISSFGRRDENLVFSAIIRSSAVRHVVMGGVGDLIPLSLGRSIL